MRLRSNEVTWREIDGEMVICDLARSTYLTTNRTGTFLLKQLADERTEDDLITALVDEFGISRELASTDARAFVALLADKGLLAA